MKNILSVDVEDFWNIYRRDWLFQSNSKPSQAVEKNTCVLLDLFAQNKIQATFFILGDVAKEFPNLIKEISKQGHEIGVHGFSHKKVFELGVGKFRSEVHEAKKILEDISGQPVLGHRAPAFSINEDTKWALEVLAEEGFMYDSSVFPAKGVKYGWKGFSEEINWVKLANGLQIIEIPMSVFRCWKLNIGTGGSYFRLLPYVCTKIMVKYLQRNNPVVFYMHPYEIDVQEEVIAVDNLSDEKQQAARRFYDFQFKNRKKVLPKIENLFHDFNFTSAMNILKEKQLI